MAAGQRPISNVVDASNYVMIELGKPIHVFDGAAVHDGRIIVRRAIPGERIETLDHVDRALDPETLVIADPRGPIGIAGVMGGADSEVGEGTTDVAVESAIFDPVSIRRTAFRYALRSDASLRFEKGQEFRLARVGADRTAQLVADWAGGAVAPGAVDSNPIEPPAARVAFRPARVNRLLGTSLSAARAGRAAGPGRDRDRTGADRDPDHGRRRIEAARARRERRRRLVRDRADLAPRPGGRGRRDRGGHPGARLRDRAGDPAAHADARLPPLAARGPRHRSRDAGRGRGQRGRDARPRRAARRGAVPAAGRRPARGRARSSAPAARRSTSPTRCRASTRCFARACSAACSTSSRRTSATAARTSRSSRSARATGPATGPPRRPTSGGASASP